MWFPSDLISDFKLGQKVPMMIFNHQAAENLDLIIQINSVFCWTLLLDIIRVKLLLSCRTLEICFFIYKHHYRRISHIYIIVFVAVCVLQVFVWQHGRVHIWVV